MSKTTLTRRGVLKSGAVAGAGVALPTNLLLRLQQLHT